MPRQYTGPGQEPESILHEPALIVCNRRYNGTGIDQFVLWRMIDRLMNHGGTQVPLLSGKGEQNALEPLRNGASVVEWSCR
jgi:hypothetical protein